MGGVDVRKMEAPVRITRHVYCVGGPSLTDPYDCLIYLVDLDESLVLVDAGAGRSVEAILSNITRMGLNPESVSLLVLTHEHIDHVGGAADLRGRLGCQVAAHQAAAPAIEQGDQTASAASLYGLSVNPCPVDLRLMGKEGEIPGARGALCYLHTPGHTPGSIVLYFDDGGRRVLFGQDLHGPFSPAWGSDVSQWRASMERVLALEADILCEGHYGVYRGKHAVRQFILGLLDRHAGMQFAP